MLSSLRVLCSFQHWGRPEAAVNGLWSIENSALQLVALLGLTDCSCRVSKSYQKELSEGSDLLCRSPR